MDELKKLLKTATQSKEWRVANRDPVRVVDGTGDYIALCDPHHKGDPLQEFRAALIAAAVNALPKLLDDLKRLRAERDRMREALEKISERHVPDQPAADGSDEADYVRKHHTDLRRIARAAIGETK